jgi:myo-inositol-1(or 4)-monophosphatase
MNDLDLALEAASAAAEAIRSRAADVVDPEFKGEVNPVTAADRAAEDAIVDLIRRHRPDDGILTEEGSDRDSTSQRRWVVDPLDGTVNFLHGVPHVGVSIAVEDSDGPVVGVVLDVFRDEAFSAVRGDGARRDGESIAVSSTRSLDRSLVVTGFPYDRREHATAYAGVVAAVLQRAQGVRRLGSAALDLAWIACGRYDGYWEIKLEPWDVAAGLLLVAEAGGRSSASDGGPASHADCVASNGLIHDELRTVVRRAMTTGQGTGPGGGFDDSPTHS